MTEPNPDTEPDAVEPDDEPQDDNLVERQPDLVEPDATPETAAPGPTGPAPITALAGEPIEDTKVAGLTGKPVNVPSGAWLAAITPDGDFARDDDGLIQRVRPL